jgi:LETM1 and EF-hand domain-containing protein 1, mitochondrial
MKRELQARIAVAAFIQETLHQNAKVKQQKCSCRGDRRLSGAKEVIQCVEKARRGEPLSKENIIRISRLFKKELILANISRPYLISMCKYMGLPSYGSDEFLRFELRMKVTSIREDDRRIMWEGIDTLTTEELREACEYNILLIIVRGCKIISSTYI